MTKHLLQLATDELRAIAAAIRSRRLLAPFTSIGLSRLVSPTLADPVAMPVVITLVADDPALTLPPIRLRRRDSAGR